MNFENIKKLMKMLEESSLSYLEVEEDGMRICLDKNGGIRNEKVAAKETEVAKEETKTKEKTISGKEITSPLVGTYHSSPYKDAKPFVSVGDKVKKGDKLCIVEAMKVMNEITSSFDGIVKEICLQDGDMVEFGKKLFVIGD